MNGQTALVIMSDRFQTGILDDVPISPVVAAMLMLLVPKTSPLKSSSKEGKNLYFLLSDVRAFAMRDGMTASQAVNAMKRHKLVTGRRSESDNRQFELTLTPAGHKLSATIQKRIDKFIQSASKAAKISTSQAGVAIGIVGSLLSTPPRT